MYQRRPQAGGRGGYFLYSTAAIRPLRTAYIAQATEAASRTRWPWPPPLPDLHRVAEPRGVARRS